MRTVRIVNRKITYVSYVRSHVGKNLAQFFLSVNTMQPPPSSRHTAHMEPNS